MTAILNRPLSLPARRSSASLPVRFSACESDWDTGAPVLVLGFSVPVDADMLVAALYVPGDLRENGLTATQVREVVVTQITCEGLLSVWQAAMQLSREWANASDETQRQWVRCAAAVWHAFGLPGLPPVCPTDPDLYCGGEAW
jgi:hypothetical protein